MKEGYIYILGNRSRSTFYVGVTNDIERRVLEHKTGLGSKFTGKYHLKMLLYYEYYENIGEAKAREVQLKNWKRQWKLDLITDENPHLMDLAADWFDEEEIAEFRSLLVEMRRS